VTAITSLAGDTLATGSMNYFGQIGGTQQLYSVYSVNGNALPNNFNGYVHFTYDNQTCVLPYPCIPACNATFTWVDNGNGTITTAAAPYVSGNEYTWVLTEGSGGLATTYDNFGNITLTLVPGEQYGLCLTLSNALSNCSNEYCTSVSVPATATCNAEFTYTGPLPIDNSYQFIGVMNDTAAYHEWTFGDGTSSALDMPFHSFATSGMYEVCHIVGISGVCSDTICYTANFIGNNSTGLYIAGEVNAGANIPDLGSVKLFSLDTLSNSVALIAQYTLSNSGSYYFGGLSTGIYLIKAGLSSSSSYYGDYVPTYFGSQFYWFDAEPVFLTESGDNYNISLIYAGNGGGPGSVSGSIDDGPYRLMDPESAGVESANPVAGADVVVTNLSGNPQRWTDADNSGNYAISNLDYGTYRLMADEPGMLCVPIE
ncbi:MAG: carboxypeptidase-like regulatory domain-containing protein, partial [Bacteroidia bacterium]